MDGANVMICATHTHTGPRTMRGKDKPSLFRINENDKPTLQWFENLPERAAKAVAEAMEDQEPCAVSWASSQEDRIAFNRRYRMRDGTVQTNPTHKNPDIVEPAGPIDPEVGVLAFKRPDGTLKALYVNYSCHLDNVGGSDISADYPGYLTRRLQERFEDRPFVLYTNGACGDVTHENVRSPYRRVGHEHSRWMGETLAGDVCEALKQMVSLSDKSIGVTSNNVQLPMRDGTAKEVGQAEIQVIRIGNLGFVGVPGELFVELQLDIKRRSPLKRTFVSELANGWIGYVPTKKAFEENPNVSSRPMRGFARNGYEIRSALSQGFVPGFGEVIADASVEFLRRTWKKRHDHSWTRHLRVPKVPGRG